MSDTFWVQLFGFLTLIAGGAWKHYVDRMAAKKLSDEMQQNTKVTEAVLPAVEKKVDSVTLENEKAAGITKDAAQILATQTAKNQEVLVTTVKELATTIKGSDGTCFTGRLEKLEKVVSDLKSGHEDIRGDLDRVLKAIESNNVHERV